MSNWKKGLRKLSALFKTSEKFLQSLKTVIDTYFKNDVMDQGILSEARWTFWEW